MRMWMKTAGRGRKVGGRRFTGGGGGDGGANGRTSLCLRLRLCGAIAADTAASDIRAHQIQWVAHRVHGSQTPYKKKIR
jgi:hypothetical protein